MQCAWELNIPDAQALAEEEPRADVRLEQRACVFTQRTKQTGQVPEGHQCPPV